MKYVIQNPDILGGAPVILGTRVPAIRLIALIRQGYTEDTLREEFPHISSRRLRGALAELLEEGMTQLAHGSYGRRSPSKTQTAAR